MKVRIHREDGHYALLKYRNAVNLDIVDIPETWWKEYAAFRKEELKWKERLEVVKLKKYGVGVCEICGKTATMGYPVRIDGRDYHRECLKKNSPNI
ncbi:MAG: hypothetical protein A2776_02885 [Candidatus Levybacteria bacterium RIFCSPHIGHO2_01_FULL_40_10]|nr:MAG: hypothetical protein A2776_02885 [Candidatus Levybacteria bacterium RIFCSPHIGHO2_01_FULL_40_10]